jgi:LuxR family transcriptional regulator, maltose regulon positive regulatory protein
MVDALVRTKLVAPRVRSAMVERSRLTEALDRARDSALVLVSAPAGFGKTTLLAVALRDRTGAGPLAWVSLDARDGEPSRFWTYVLHALDAAVPGCATAALARLESGQGRLEDVVTTLVNELSVQVDEVTLVLDDYHLADTHEVSESVSLLLAHQPPQLHVVISTRADPALPLPRLRVRGELVEIRAADLRFTAAEAGSYLNTVHELGLSAGDVEALESRTEGWVAALQLAALSLHGRADTSTFIASFAGDDRYVVDYLVDEVLDQQPAALRRFLLDTSVLDRLCGALCDAVTGGAEGRATLETLERRNLLLVALDDHRDWYRYHHLFADVLHARLLAERPEDIPGLHQRASEWYDDRGDVEPAVRHAFAAGDLDRAADLIERAATTLRRDRAEATLAGWIEQLPEAMLARRPVLASVYVGALMAANLFDGVDLRLDAVEAGLAAPPDTLVIRDRAEWERLPALVATQRAALALVAGDLEATIAHAEAALARAAPHDELTAASASALKGLASWASGDLAAARSSYTSARDGLVAAGHVSDALGSTVTLVDLDVQQGDLDGARRAAQHALDLAGAGEGQPLVRGTADMLTALARVEWERGDTSAALDLLHRSADLGEGAGLPQQAYRWRVAMAHVREAQGDLRSADALLAEAERVYNTDFSPDVRPVPATRARLHVRTGDLAAARRWARAAGVSPDDEPTYLREHEHVTLARLLLADHDVSTAGPLLRRLHEAAAAGGRTAVVIETLVLRALAVDLTGSVEEAVALLEEAAALARPRGWTRPFLGEGPRLTELLRLTGGGSTTFPLDATLTASHADAAASRAGAPEPLVVPLSSRELDVLRLLASDLDGPAIARHLHVSLATVRTHTQHVYAKLGVNNRRAAVRRGHQLNL